MAASVILSVPQVVDVALGTPEVGTVNFNILQTLLHILVQQINLGSTNIEFRGQDADRLSHIMSKSKPAGKINMQEYSIKGGDESAKKEFKGDTVIVVDSSENETKTPQLTVAVSKNDYLNILDDIESIKKKLKDLAELPGKLGIVDAIKTAKNSPVLDMFHIINLSKRIEATESGLDKVGLILEEAIRSGGGGIGGGAAGGGGGAGGGSVDRKGSDSMMKRGSKVGEIAGPLLQELQKLQDRIVDCEHKLGIGEDGPHKSEKEDGGGAGAGGVGGAMAETAMEALRCLDKCNTQTDYITEELTRQQEQLKLIIDGLNNLDVNNLEKSLKDLKNAGQSALSVPTNKLEVPTAEIKRSYILEDAPSSKPGSPKSKISDNRSADQRLSGAGPHDSLRLNQLENRVLEHTQQIKSIDNQYSVEISTLKSSFGEMEKLFNAILERINVNAPADGADNQEVDTTELFNKTLSLQADIENISDIANRLLQDKEEKQKDMEAFMEQIEFLKTVKADREDLEDALADKADACAVTRKVSHDQFDAACDDLSKGIEEALEKLTQQEQLWSQALDDIQREIGTKLDKMELGPLRDFVNHKLKVLQERLKALTALKREQEAAGTKQKLLKDVNCISCDKEVVMRKQIDPSTMPKPYAMPPTRSMGPYLAYELDALRKQQKCLPTSKNLHHFESALQGKQESSKEHICNRYCGGSHTVTTPQQRVTRMGHFVTQWGPEVIKCSEGMVKGADGQMYKADQEYDSANGPKPPVLVKAAIPQGQDVAQEPEVTRKSATMQTETVKRGSTASAKERKGSATSNKSAPQEKRPSQELPAPRTSKDKKQSVSSRRSSRKSAGSVKADTETAGGPEGETAEITPIKEETESEVAKDDEAVMEESPPAGETTATAEGEAEGEGEVEE